MSLRSTAAKLFSRLRDGNLLLVTAESLTGGMIGSAITAIPGSSAVFWGGVVVYSNRAKHALLGVPEGLIDSAGPVSAEVASAMAVGALSCCENAVSLAVTGLAGPGGGTRDLPVGSVWIAAACSSMTGEPEVLVRLFHFSGSRSRIRRKTAGKAFALTLELLDR